MHAMKGFVLYMILLQEVKCNKMTAAEQFIGAEIDLNGASTGVHISNSLIFDVPSVRVHAYL